MAKDRSQSVIIHGLPEFKRGLRSVDAGLSKGLAAEFRGVAENVASKVRGRVARLTGRAAGTVVSKGTQAGGRVEAGGAKAEYYPWLDFGGSVGRGDSIHRPVVSTGRYLYPTIADERGNTEDAVADIIERVGERAGFGVREGVL